MPLPTTTRDEFAAHLRALGVRPGDHLAVHSRLIAFGRIEGETSTVYETLREAVRPAGTIVVPTYTLEPGVVYDPRTTPSQSVGVLSEFVRLLPGAVRSLCPMHNHAGVGAKAACLLGPDGTVSIGLGSDFDVLLKQGFRLLLLGTGLTEGATFMHHVETLAEVPYRAWYDLSRKRLRTGGTVETVVCRYYGRPDPSYAEAFDRLEPMLLERGVMTRRPTHFGASRLVALADLLEAGMEALRRDPYALVKRT